MRELTWLFAPTVNSYKRFGPDTLAPWLIDWGLDPQQVAALPHFQNNNGKAPATLLEAGINLDGGGLFNFVYRF